MRGFAWLTGFWLVLLGLTVQADTWVPPQVRDYASASGEYVLTVEPQGATGTNALQPRGRLVTASGAVLWERSLVNAVAPVNALVAADGRYVVTFDNWGAIGYGPDVVVIYGPSGELIRALTLTDILGASRVARLRGSIDSRWWAGEHRFESAQVLALSVLADGEDFFNAAPRYDTLRLQLDTGTLIP